MPDSMPFPQPLIPLVVAGFVLTIGAWLVRVRRWRDLSRLYRTPRGAAAEPIHAFPFARLSLPRDGLSPSASFGRAVLVEVSEAGLYLGVLVGGRHTPLLIPWARMERMESRRHLLFHHALTIRVRGTRTRVRLFGEPARVVEEGWRRYGPERADGRGFPPDSASAIFRAPGPDPRSHEQAQR